MRRPSRRRLLQLAAVSPLAAGLPRPGRAQAEAWTAKWIACAGAPPVAFGVYHFRRAFELPAAPRSFPVHVTADNRYRLYVNGRPIGRGPARGDLQHWRYETYDLAPHLRAGRNVIAAVVWSFAELAPMAQHSARTGLLLQGASAAARAADTGDTWKAAPDAGWSAVTPNPFPPQTGCGERIDAARVPWGWEQPGFDDGGWQAAAVIGPAAPREMANGRTPWALVPRSIPAMEETPERPARVRRTGGVTAPAGFPGGRGELKVPARTRAVVLLDQTYLTTGYPELVASGGRGARVRVAYGENLWGAGPWDKGHRDEIEGKTMRGPFDELVLDGGARRALGPLWWRCWRYLELTIETTDEPLVVHDVRATYTGYPFARAARFAGGDAELGRILDVGWRTARLCAHETYMDCPFWEQMQYVGDTRIQALISLYVAGDDRLMRNALLHFDDSRVADQPTTSRYPSSLPQYIPPFALWWIGMVHDHYRYRDDPAFVRRLLPGVRAVLSFFAARQLPDGRLGPLPWWNFVDWTPNWRAGVPPGWNIGFTQGTPKGTLPRDNTARGLVPRDDPRGSSAPIDLQLLLAYDWAAELEGALGSPALAAEHAAAATRLRETVRRYYWFPERNLFGDTGHPRGFSQHANALAVLGRVVEGAPARALVERVLSDPDLEPASIYFLHYVHEAMREVGLGDRYLEQLGPWRRMLALGLTTWAETLDPSRSECHAWGSSPNLQVFRTVLGIDSAAPGFRRVSVRPHLGKLDAASGTMPHPRGPLVVALRRQGAGLRAEVTLPPGIDGTFAWNGETRPLRAGRNAIHVGG